MPGPDERGYLLSDTLFNFIESVYRSWEDGILPALPRRPRLPPASRCVPRCFTPFCKLTTTTGQFGIHASTDLSKHTCFSGLLVLV